MPLACRVRAIWATRLINARFNFKGGGWLLLFGGVAIFGALVTNAMANVAAAALILPIVIPMAQLEGVDPRVLALCLGTATSFAMLLVIGCPPNAIAYSYRQFKSSDLTKAGLVNKVRGPYDGRVVMVELTDQGRQLMRRRRKRVREGYQALFEKLQPAERDSFLGSLKSLPDILSKVTD